MWKYRNKFIFEGGEVNESVMCDVFMMKLEECCNTNSNTNLNSGILKHYLQWIKNLHRL